MADDRLLDGLGAQGQEFFAPGDKKIHGWCMEAVREGERINKSDPNWDKMDRAQDYVLGDQLMPNRPPYLPSVVVNQTKKAIRTHVSALTDLKPLFAFKTLNRQFDQHAFLLNNLTTGWWTSSFSDMQIGDAVKYAATGGAGDLVVEWDPNAAMGQGDIRMMARDPRDTLPVRPSRYGGLQDWEGVIIREAHSPEKLRGKYPGHKDLLTPDTDGSLLGRIMTRFKKVTSPFTTPVSTLDGLKGIAAARTAASSQPEINLYRCHLVDRTINTTGKPVLMGDPLSNWSYLVPPGERLYPGKRLILFTERTLLSDGPMPYWCPLFPVSRLQLESWPWSFFGLSVVNDLMPAQDALNRVVNDFLTVFQQAVSRGIIADKRAIPEAMLKRLDVRKPNWKAQVNATMGDGFKLADVPQLPAWALQFLEMMFTKFDELSETANLQALLQLRQMPGADTIQAFSEALTPGIRLEARMLEMCLRDISEMVKGMFFQFYSTERRVSVLGPAGATLSDFDFDPRSLVPSMEAGQQGYMQELDHSLTRQERAKFFLKLFTFGVAPGSILALHAQEEQMKYVQLSRQGLLDVWTLLEMLEVPNVGAPPVVMLPPKNWVPQMDPVTQAPLPPPAEPRVPETIIERLMAQQQLGIGQTVSPAGRKASGQQPPEQKTRSDGSTYVSESG